MDQNDKERSFTVRESVRKNLNVHMCVCEIWHRNYGKSFWIAESFQAKNGTQAENVENNWIKNLARIKTKN